MPLSSGTRSLVTEIASWAALACVLVAALVNYRELKTFSAALIGLPHTAESQQVAEASPQPAPSLATLTSGAVELRASENGHFHAEAEINGRTVEVLVDTGATMVALSYEDAEQAGIYLNGSDFTHRVSTANGIARVAPVTLDSVSIGDITVRDVQAAVTERGRLKTSLLGMSFLGRLERVDMRAGTLFLQN